MNIILRFAFCLILAAILSSVPVHVAQDGTNPQPEHQDQTTESTLRQFSDEEISAARKSLADLTPKQRSLVNHLRYLFGPQYEEDLMAGRAFRSSPLTPYEQPGAEFENADALRLWAALASGLPATDATRGWLRLFVDAPVPSGSDSLGELALHMAVCALGVQRDELGLADKLTERAEDLLAAAEKSRKITADRSPLIVGSRIDPSWYGNQLCRALICRFALEMDLNINEYVWQSAIRDLLSAGDESNGWTSKAANNSEAEDLDSNLFAIAALSLAATAPEGAIGKGLERKLDESMRMIPAVLKRLDESYPSAARVGTRLAVILSFAPDLAPEGKDAKAWRESVTRLATEEQDPSGMVVEGGSVGRELGLTDVRRSQRVSETALECVALSGGLMGSESPLANLSLSEVGRAMHACSVLHANELPEGFRRTAGVYGSGHELPEPRAIESYMLDGLDYLIDAQHEDGGWGSARSGRSGAHAGTYDPGSTAFVALALLRAGHTPLDGEHQDAVLKATEYIVDVVEEAAEEGPRITEATGTQLQGKLGKIVDTAVVTQFLARVLPTVESDRELYGRVAEALDKCILKIELSQDEDGGWITQGWAPVLQSAMFNQALELAELAGCAVDRTVLERSRAYLARDVEIEGGKTAPAKRSTSAGVAFYAGSSALRATAGDTAEVMIVMEQARKDRTVSANAKVSDSVLHELGYSKEDAAAKATAFKRYEAMLAKLEDENYLKGFGNNGGEEFISYMLSSESIVITGHDTWSKWNDKMHNTFEKIQNDDGSWSGHHCISSPILCTAAVLMTLTADREVHVVVETGPRGRTTSGDKSDNKNDKKSEGPVTGK